MCSRTWKDEQLETAVATSKSIAGVLTKLKLKEAGGNYASIKKHIARLRLDTSHFVGQSWMKGTKPGPKRPLWEYLGLDARPISSYNLKARLFTDKVKERRCERCDRDKWEGSPIPLELDHINGNSKDNRLENLRVLCANCHALTPTYRGKNIRSGGGTADTETLKVSA